MERISIGRTYTRLNFSAWRAARVLGVTSVNIRRTVVTTTVEIITADCVGRNESARVVARAAAAVLARLFPSRIVAKSLSGRPKIRSTRDALATPLVTK